MDFTFGEDQLLLQTTVRDFLGKECPPERIRAQWESAAGARRSRAEAGPTGHDPALWSALAELGVVGLLVPEAHGGMGLTEVDAVLVWEECGRAALAAPVVATAAVAAPLLAELGGEAAAHWLPRIARGEAVVAVADAASPLVEDAAVADLLALASGDEVHLLAPDAVRTTPQPAYDPSRRLFSVDWTPVGETRAASGARGRALHGAAFDRGALACAAQALGVAERLLELAVTYALERRQFGVPIGSFQAVKHRLADVKVALEYARPAVQRAAFSVATGAAARALHVSMAKVLACDAAQGAARAALQVHGAIGYTWEQDLHLWMRRAGSLEQAFGRSDFHRRRVEEHVLGGGARLGPGETFRGD